MSAVKRGLPERRRMRHDRHYVDELTQRMGEGLGRMIPVAAITSNHDQPRSTLGDLANLIASISKHGVLEPLLVRRRDDGPNSYELVSGERRFHAALQAGLAEVPCIELTVGDETALEIALVENLQRKDLTPFEEADGFRTLLEKYRYTHDQIATAVGRSRVTVTETLRILDLPDSVRERCRHADILAKGILLELAKAPDEESMHTLLDAIEQEGADRAELRRLRAALAGVEPAGAAGGSSDGNGIPESSPAAKRNKPFVVRLSRPDRPFTLSLAFRTENEPATEDIIAALEEMLQELRAASGGGASST